MRKLLPKRGVPFTTLLVVGGFFFLVDVQGPSSGDGVAVEALVSSSVVWSVFGFTCREMLSSTGLLLAGGAFVSSSVV